MEIWQSHWKCARKRFVGAAMIALMLMPCAASAKSIQFADSSDTGATFLSGPWIEPIGSETPPVIEACQTTLCDVWTEPTLRAATWQRAKASGDDGDLKNFHLAPEPSGAVLALMGMVLGWWRLRNKLRS